MYVCVLCLRLSLASLWLKHRLERVGIGESRDFMRWCYASFAELHQILSAVLFLSMSLSLRLFTWDTHSFYLSLCFVLYSLAFSSYGSSLFGSLIMSVLPHHSYPFSFSLTTLYSWPRTTCSHPEPASKVCYCVSDWTAHTWYMTCLISLF